MDKSIGKKISISLIIMMFILYLFTFKATYGDYEYGIIGQGEGFLEAGEGIKSKVNTVALSETTEYAIRILLAVGIVAAVIVAIVLGIQFMLSGVEQKAQIKEALIPFVVGCVVIFGAFTIWEVFVNLGNSFEESKYDYNSNSTEVTCKSCNEKLSGKLAEAALKSSKCPRCGLSIY